MSQKLYDLHSVPFDFAPGGTIALADVAALAAYDDSEVDAGGFAYTTTLRSPWFKLVISPAPAGDNITTVATASGDGAWIRIPNPRAWKEEVVFYIDEVSGDDENDGLTPLTPLASLSELSRRTYLPSEYRPDYILNVGPGGVGAGESWSVAVGVSIVGELTVVHAGADITAVVQADKGVAGVRQSLTAPALTFGADNKLVVTDNSGQFPIFQFGWAVSAKGDPLADSAYTEIFRNGSIAVLSATSSISEYSLPEFFAHITVENGGNLIINDCILLGSIEGGDALEITDCLLSGTDSLTLRNVTNSTLDRCKVSEQGNSLHVTACDDLNLSSIVVPVGGDLQLRASNVNFVGDCAITGGLVNLLDQSDLNVEGDLELSNNASLTLAAPETSLQITGAITLWGAGGSSLELSFTNTRVTYDPTSTWTSDGTYSHPDGAGAATSADLVTLPATQSTASMATHAVGIFRDG